MTEIEQDPFDARLQAMFAEAAPPEDDPAFVEDVVAHLARPERRRFLLLGGAGASGSAVAGTQLERLLDTPVEQMGGLLGELAGFMGPEAIVTVAMAAIALGFAWVLPRRGFA
ncbi:hypothetical protein DDZ18_06715 [Marinicauda salina]|uniref:Uncharacterized protein n=1 Tax=Marinicauda salina TaxID=2135793 RepID=A0A2U2BTP4_9PROT|nr:hypothetical protein [Marinicauda salina]PWE17371.1 hypothetical protein DDZ18_06715 [Marinicauda salina]